MLKRMELRTWGWIVCCLGSCVPAPTAAPPAPTMPPLKAVTPDETTVPVAAETETPEQASAEQAAADAPLEPVIEPEVATVDEPSEPETPFSLEEGFTSLSFQDFDAFQAEPDTWSATDEGVQSTGKPKGYLYSLASHQNFTWKLEYRFDRPKSLKDDAKFKGNTGFLVYINGEHKLWPLCLEVQGKHVQIAEIKENGGAAPVMVQEDKAARQTARKPVGQWNRLEITSRDGAISVKLNDVPISRSEPNFLSEGQIGLQAEDHPFAVRRMRIRDE